MQLGTQGSRDSAQDEHEGACLCVNVRVYNILCILNLRITEQSPHILIRTEFGNHIFPF